MTKEEATDFLAWLKAKESESHFLARFKTWKPLVVSNPEYYDKKREAQIVLGIFQWQRPYEELAKVHPGLTPFTYQKYREKYNLQ